MTIPSESEKLVQRMAPALQRVLIVDPSASSARVLADLMRSLLPCQVWMAPSRARATELLKAVEPQIIFVENQGADIDGAAFTATLRRSDLPCRQAPVIMVTATATAQAILAARDSGVHEFLRKPYSIKDLIRRLEAVTLRPRGWIEAVRYVGPDRRRFNSGEYAGPRKRGVDAAEAPGPARVGQALKILKAAHLAVGSDPHQALRSLRAQAQELQLAGVAVQDPRLAAAAADLQRALDTSTGPMDQAKVSNLVTTLLAFAPPEQGEARQVA